MGRLWVAIDRKRCEKLNFLWKFTLLLMVHKSSRKMLDLVTCAILSIITTMSLIVLAIGSSYRLKKIRQQDLKIVLPKTVLENHQPGPIGLSKTKQSPSIQLWH